MLPPLPSVELLSLSPVSHHWSTYGLCHISFKHGDTGNFSIGTQGGGRHMMEEMMNLVCNLKTITQHFIFYRIYCIGDVCMPEALQEQLSVAKRHWHLYNRQSSWIPQLSGFHIQTLRGSVWSVTYSMINFPEQPSFFTLPGNHQ